MRPKSIGVGESDGRLVRSGRTRRELIEAYIILLREKEQIPTVAQITDRAGYSMRTMYLHFSDIADLSIAACDYAIEQRLSVPVGDNADADRKTRIRFQVETRARNCEDWLPLWRMLMHYESSVPELSRRVALARRLVYERMQLMYRPELASLSDIESRAVLLSIEALTDYECWGRMRSEHGLSFDEGCRAWITAIDRLLPPTPAS